MEAPSYTYSKKEGGHQKLYSHWNLLRENGPCTPPPVSLPIPARFQPPSLWLALVNFEPNISLIYTPKLKSWVSLLRCTPTKMERIARSETSALIAQTPGDCPKDIIQLLLCLHRTVHNWLYRYSSLMPWNVYFIIHTVSFPLIIWHYKRRKSEFT